MQETTKDNTISNVLIEMGRTIEKIGIDDTIDLLKYSRQKISEISGEDLENTNKVVNVVCKIFDISIKEFNSSLRKNNRRYAIGIATQILTDIYGLDISDLSFLFKKPDGLLSIYRKEIRELNPKHKVDIKLIEKKELILEHLKNPTLNK